MKTIITFFAFLLLSFGSYAQTAKDSLKDLYKPYLDLTVKAIEEATGKTSIYGIPYSFIESIVLLVIVGVVLGMHKKALADANAAHQKALQAALNAHTETIADLTKK